MAFNMMAGVLLSARSHPVVALVFLIIAGEVNAPQSLLAQEGRRVSEYVREAGGFTPRADRRNILVFRQDGQLRRGGEAMPGDRILVMSKPDSTLLPFLRDLTQTIFQMAGVLVAVDRFSE